MEYGLRDVNAILEEVKANEVLILVLMEYGLRVYRWKTVERETPAS